jgi:hypothetical protein
MSEGKIEGCWALAAGQRETEDLFSLGFYLARAQWPAPSDP